MDINDVRRALDERRLSVVSEATGLHPNTIAKIRDGDTTDPQPATLSRLIDYINGSGPRPSRSGLDVLSIIEDAARHAWGKKFYNQYSGDCSITILPEGFCVSCRVRNLNEVIDTGESGLYAEHRMINYHAVESSKFNILIDAIDLVADNVLGSASEYKNEQV